MDLHFGKFNICICLIFVMFLHSSEQKSVVNETTVEDTCAECICHPSSETNGTQYVVGYGSFIKSSSIKRTDPKAGESIPVIVDGYQRIWNAQGASVGYSTTYLGVEQRENSSFNGIVFSLPIPEGNQTALDTVKNYDLREAWYCRHKLSIDKINFLNGPNTRSGEYWIYVIKPEFDARPNKKYPIVQSYVDIFITGCIEIEERFSLPGYTSACVKSTEGWNKHWVNDRIIPRRPNVHQPMANKIDVVLAKELPNIFKDIQIEG